MGKILNGLILLTALATPAAGITLTTFQDPLGVEGTEAAGLDQISGLIVGNYNDSFGADHGFIYDGSSFKTVDDSPTDQSISTIVAGVSGNVVVGNTLDTSGLSSPEAHGFLFDGTKFKIFDDPLATGTGTTGTFPAGISGNNVVGIYLTPTSTQGFLYDGSTFTTLDDPLGAQDTHPQGISGSTIVGWYTDSTRLSHGFIYNGTNYTTLDDPLGVNGTQPLGVSGKYIIGIYFDSASKQHDFLYDGSKYTTLDNLGGVPGTKIMGISGNTVVGWYFDANLRHTVSFIATVPEPSTLILAAIGGLALLGYRRRK